MNRRNVAGWSLIELITVLVMLSALAIVAYPRLATNETEAAVFHQQILNAARYAHQLSVQTGCDVQLDVDAVGDSYALHLRNGAGGQSCGAGAFTVAVRDPVSGDPYAAGAPGGVDISSGLTTVFDSLGRPSASGVIVVSGRSITIEAGTGYVH
jgi:type II secretory pathway pseudopilin PulG